MTEQPPVAGLVERRILQQKVLAQIESLPSLSSVVGEFLALAKREVFVAMDFERVLIKDQALVARLLKVANSSFFGSSKPIKTVHEAMVLIGLDNMRNIVYAVSSSGLLKRALKNYAYPHQGFWLHSMGVGMTCRALIEAGKGLPMDAEEGFVSGLVHDIGKLILDDHLDAAPGKRKISLEEEREAAGFDHTELGDRILQRWNIGGNIREAVRYHHAWRADGQLRLGAGVVDAADRLCNHWGVGTKSLMNLGEDVPLADYREIIEALGMETERFRAQLWDLRQKLSAIENYYAEDA